MRAHPPVRVVPARREQQLHHLRPGRLAAPHDHGDPRSEPGSEEVHPEVVPGPGVEPEERAHRPRDVRQPHGERHGAAARGGVRRVPAAPAPRQRLRLRRPDLEHRGRPAALPRRRRALPPPVPARPGRRVPGHQPRPVRADQGARRHGDRGPAGRPAVRRRRRGPVDLRLPRRDHPQHRGVRARLPERHDDHARAELPLHADHPHGGQRRHLPQCQPAGEAAVDRRGCGQPDRGLRRRRRARRGVLHRERDRPPDGRRGPEAVGRRGLLPHQRPVALGGGDLHPGRPAVPRRRWHPLLRAPRGPRRHRLPACPGESRRRGLPAPHPQHPQARHRRPRGGDGRGVRAA